MSLYKGNYRIESARLRGWDYGSPGWYFVTICAQNRQCLLGEIIGTQMNLSVAGSIVEAEVRNIPTHYSDVLVDSFVVMPNHLHAIIVIEGMHRFSPSPSRPVPHGSALLSKATSLSSIVGSFKSGVTYRWHRSGFPNCAWQPRFYEHILRCNVSVNAVREYIENNPLRWAEDQENPEHFPPRKHP